MVLAPTTRLGPFQMPAPLGAGVDRFRGLSWQFRRMARASRPPRAKAPASGRALTRSRSVHATSAYRAQRGAVLSRMPTGRHSSPMASSRRWQSRAVSRCRSGRTAQPRRDGGLHPASAASGTDQKYYSSENASTLSRNGAHCNPNGKFAVEGKHAHIVYSGGNDRSMRVSLFWVSSRRYPSRCSAALAVRRSPSLIGSTERAPR